MKSSDFAILTDESIQREVVAFVRESSSEGWFVVADMAKRYRLHEGRSW